MESMLIKNISKILVEVLDFVGLVQIVRKTCVGEIK